MTDLSDITVERGPYGPNGSGTPVGTVTRPSAQSPRMTVPPTVARMALYRVVPAGTALKTIDIAKRQLGFARDHLAFGGWVQGSYAIGEGDFECDPSDPKAHAWSLTGVLVKVFGPAEQWTLGCPADIAAQAIAHSIRERHGRCTIQYFNDLVAEQKEDVLAEVNAALDLLDDIIKGRGL